MADIDRAKLIEAARTDLAELQVQHRAIADLQTLVDDKLRDLYRSESRVRSIFKHLGFPMPDGPFDVDVIVKALEAGVKDG